MILVAKKTTYDEVKNFIEIESNSNCKLLSKEYLNSASKMKFQCGCGDKFETTYSKFKSRNKRQCNNCGINAMPRYNKLKFQEVKKYIEIDSESGCKLFSKEYNGCNEDITVKCSCDDLFITTFKKFKISKHKMCKNCLKKIKRYNSFTLQDAQNKAKKLGCEIICDEDKWHGTQEKYRFKCECGNEFTRLFSSVNEKNYLCLDCSNRRRNKSLSLKYEDVKLFIELKSQSGCELLSNEYINNATDLKIKCKCGNIFYTTYSSFKQRDKNKCDDCSRKILSEKFRHDFDYVQKYIESYNSILLSNTYVNSKGTLLTRCLECGHNYESTFHNFTNTKYKCTTCANKSISEQLSFSSRFVADYLLKYGYKLTSSYVNCDTKLKIICPENHVFYMDFYHFKNRNQRCSVCYSLKDKSGENSASWQGGLTHLNHMLRETLKEWKFKSLELYNFKCALSGVKEDLEVHHIKSFNKIVQDILNELSIPYKKEVSNYTPCEINDIKLLFSEHHSNNLGIPLNRETHNLFHSIYGWDNNKKQLDEFISNYKINLKG